MANDLTSEAGFAAVYAEIVLRSGSGECIGEKNGNQIR
jgi:hypothetical protein